MIKFKYTYDILSKENPTFMVIRMSLDIFLSQKISILDKNIHSCVYKDIVWDSS